MLNHWKTAIIARLKAIQQYIWMAIGIVVLFGMLAFAEKTHKEAAVKSIDVEIKSPKDHRFVRKSDVLYLVREETKAPLEGHPIEQLSLDSLEISLKKQAFIKAAEVFANVNGRLQIRVEQRNPILRVINQSGQSYYIDEQGLKMPVSKEYTARVLTATGHIQEGPEPIDSMPGKTVQNLYKLSKRIQQDEFLASLTGSIHVDEYGEFNITPRMGKNSIILGDANNLDEKFRKLRVFYERVFPREGWYQYKSINLKFDQQIIAKKAHYGKE